MSNTFSNLSVLKNTQQSVKRQLGVKYEEVITPYVEMIQMTMKANNENEFEALKRIKEKLPFYQKKDVPLLFASALIEITEVKHFQGFSN